MKRNLKRITKKFKQDQNRVYHIDYKVDLHSIYLILDLYVEQEFDGSVTWFRGPIALFVATYTEAKQTLVSLNSLYCKLFLLF